MAVTGQLISGINEQVHVILVLMSYEGNVGLDKLRNEGEVMSN